MDKSTYDLVIVGSGISCSMTICQLAKRLKLMRPGREMLRIAIVEKDGQMWTGVPYGNRATIGTLTFQKLDEFLQAPERDRFVEWLIATKSSWIKTLKECGGASANKWILDNQSLMERYQWGELYLPRFLFGLYISNCTVEAVEELRNAELASVTQVCGEAISAFRTSEGTYTVAVEGVDGAHRYLKAASMVVAVGSPPQKSIYKGSRSSQSGHVHFEDIYKPCEDITLQQIEESLAHLPDKKMGNVLIVGSNASALEMLYLINYRPQIRKLIQSVVVLSRSGLLPYKISELPVDFELTALARLEESGEFSAADLLAAITTDVRKAEEQRLNVADLRDPIASAVSRLTSLMHIKEQEKFVCKCGADFSRLMRRAGRDTSEAADELTNLGILTVVKGAFTRLEVSSSDGLMRAVYRDGNGREGIVYPTPFRITINCGGFEELDACSSRFINSLIANQLCRVNSTQRGFLVNDRLEASENLYVIGPLLAGNFNDTIRLWHAESASRISGLAEVLAKSLTQSHFTRHEPKLPNGVIPSSNLSAEGSPRPLA